MTGHILPLLRGRPGWCWWCLVPPPQAGSHGSTHSVRGCFPLARQTGRQAPGLLAHMPTEAIRLKASCKPCPRWRRGQGLQPPPLRALLVGSVKAVWARPRVLGGLGLLGSTAPSLPAGESCPPGCHVRAHWPSQQAQQHKPSHCSHCDADLSRRRGVLLPRTTPPRQEGQGPPALIPHLRRQEVGRPQLLTRQPAAPLAQSQLHCKHHLEGRDQPQFPRRLFFLFKRRHLQAPKTGCSKISWSGKPSGLGVSSDCQPFSALRVETAELLKGSTGDSARS